MFSLQTCVSFIVTPSDSVMADVGGTSLAKGRRLRSSQKKRKDEEIPEETDSIVGQVSPLPPVKEPKKSKKRKLPNAKSKVKTEAEINPEPPLPPECADTFSRNDHHGNNIDGKINCLTTAVHYVHNGIGNYMCLHVF